MKPTDTTSYHHANLKDALIEEALFMVKENGIENLTLRELTKKLGASRSAIYRHYSSKDELVKAVIVAGLSKLDEATWPDTCGNENILDRFYTMGRAYVTFAIDNPNIYRMIFGHAVEQQREATCDINDEELASGFHTLVTLLIEAQEKKIFKKEDPILQATYIWSSMHGLSNLYIDGHLHVIDNIEELFELTFNTLVNGLKY